MNLACSIPGLKELVWRTWICLFVVAGMVLHISSGAMAQSDISCTGPNYDRDSCPQDFNVCNPSVPAPDGLCSWNACLNGTCECFTASLGTLCRQATNSCQMDSYCSGYFGASCPPLGNVPNGTVCAGGLCSDGICALPPTVTAQFVPPQIPVSQATTLVFNLYNPNPIPLSGVGFTDPFPAGMEVAASPNGSNTCNGTFNPSPGATSLTLTGGTLALNGQCTIRVDVVGTSPGILLNSTGAITSTESGDGVQSNTAALTVVTPPMAGKQFGTPVILTGGTTTLTLTLSNPATNPIPLTAIALDDPLPHGLEVANPNELATNCSGTITAPPGSTQVGLSGVVLGAGSTCSVMVNVMTITGGIKRNTTTPIVSAEGGTGASVSADLMVYEPVHAFSGFGLLVLTGLLTITGAIALRRRGIESR